MGEARGGHFDVVGFERPGAAEGIFFGVDVGKSIFFEAADGPIGGLVKFGRGGEAGAVEITQEK